jgi:hypothetical protein
MDIKKEKIIYGLQIMICISFNVMGCSTNEYKIPTLANVDIKDSQPSMDFTYLWKKMKKNKQEYMLSRSC